MEHQKNRFGKYQCPCCGYYTFTQSREEAMFQDCPVCYWEDDGVQLDDPDYEGGANSESLNQARANYKRIGACNDCFQSAARSPNEDEMPQ